MAVLIACEESQRECLAFRELGIEAYSCDIQPCSGGHPEWHLQGDVRQFLSQKWDLIIAHPPCTYLANSGAVRMHNKDHSIKDFDRYNLMLAAREFFMLFYNLSGRVVIENPVPLRIACLPSPDQVIQPYYFGDPYSKKTYLWLHNVAPLMATCICEDHQSWTSLHKSAKIRSKSFPGVSRAMASQWAHYCK